MNTTDYAATGVNALHNQSVERLIADIESLRDESNERAVEICVRLVVLKTRRVSHPLMKDRFFRHFEAIASGKVLPGIVAMFGGQKKYVDLFYGRALNSQKAVLNDVEQTVAVEKDGTVIEARKAPSRLSYSALLRLFPPQKPAASYVEQRQALLAEIAAREPAKPRFRVDSAADALHVGRQVFPMEEVRSALLAAGFEVVPTARPAGGGA